MQRLYSTETGDEMLLMSVFSNKFEDINETYSLINNDLDYAEIGICEDNSRHAPTFNDDSSEGQLLEESLTF